jgi:hypothetical protein
MADAPKFRDDELPVTAEIGGEGGSFADPTYQEAARRGELSRTPDTRQPPAQGDLPGYASHRSQIEQGGAGTAPGPDEGMKKYPTEDPE